MDIKMLLHLHLLYICLLVSLYFTRFSVLYKPILICIIIVNCYVLYKIYFSNIYNFDKVTFDGICKIENNYINLNSYLL